MLDMVLRRRLEAGRFRAAVALFVLSIHVPSLSPQEEKNERNGQAGCASTWKEMAIDGNLAL